MSFEVFQEKVIDLFQNDDKSVSKEKGENVMKVKENEDIYHDETVIMPPKKEWEVVCIKLEKYKELQAENKALKKENKAYKGMWKELRKTLLSWGTPVLVAVTNNMERLQEKYLGGGE